MSTAQKIIKYLAIAFAFSIIFSIVSSILFSFSLLTDLYDNDDEKVIRELKEERIRGNILGLDIDTGGVEVNIKQGNEFKIETNSKYIKKNIRNNILYITEKKHNFFRKKDFGKLNIYIPSTQSFNTVDIDSGAGIITIDYLKAEELDFDFGAGKVDIRYINVSKEASIDTGAGKLSIDDGIINNLDLDLGVGESNITAKIIGDSDISSGVGKVVVNILGVSSDYKLLVDKGIGSFKIDGSDVSDDTVYGNGRNKIDIDSGVGSVVINFK